MNNDLGESISLLTISARLRSWGEELGGRGLLPVVGSRNANWLGKSSIQIQLRWPLRRPRLRCFESSVSSTCGGEYVELNTLLVLVTYQYVSSNNAYITQNPCQTYFL